MKTIYYLIYKIANEIIFRFKLNSSGSSVIKIKGVLPPSISVIHFEFSHVTTHFGDRLFFLPLIVRLISDGYKVSINEADICTYEMLNKIYGVKSGDISFGESADILVLPKPSFLSYRNTKAPLLVVDFMSNKITKKIPLELTVEMYRLLGSQNLEPKSFDILCDEMEPFHCLKDEEQYVVFNSYINSGNFRKYLLNNKKLIDKCIELKSIGYKIVHVGSADDLDNDNNVYDFVDLDLRGNLTASQTIDLIRNPKIVSGVSYDNFIMHVLFMCNKKCFVLFRGRFLKRNRLHHYRFVNIAFCSYKQQIEYL